MSPNQVGPPGTRLALVSDPSGWMKNYFNAPDNWVSKAAQNAQAHQAQQRAMDEATAKVTRMVGEKARTEAERAKRTLELQEATAEATAILATATLEQQRENRRLALLTRILSAAVIFDIWQGSFDDHNAWTALSGVAIAVLVVVVAPLAPRIFKRSKP